MRLLSLAIFLLSGCTFIRDVAPGTASGEFYVTVAKYPFPRGYVLRCTERALQSGDLTMCTRVLNSPEAGHLTTHLYFGYTLLIPNPDLKRTFLLKVRFKSEQSITQVQLIYLSK